ncbi:MAG: DEAD/DEAH box helicase [Myxococcota bacterium]
MPRAERGGPAPAPKHNPQRPRHAPPPSHAAPRHAPPPSHTAPRHAPPPSHAAPPPKFTPPPSKHTDEVVAASAFSQLGLMPALVRAVLDEGYETPTPIQAGTIPCVLSGRDLLGCAQTGTGKTAAFVLPTLQRLSASSLRGRLRALVLTPTRELAAQIGTRAAAYGRHVGLRHTVIYGGVSQRAQERELSRRPELLVATPGRLLDLFRQGFIDFSALEVLILDEADTMLDMGFIHDVRRIVAEIPSQRQTLLFSATMPPVIEQLARNILKDPERVAVTPQATTAETVDQAVYFVAKENKRALLERVLANGVERALVFTRTKHGADRVAKQLVRAGIEAAAIHGNKSQNARERALEAFRRGTSNVLVATDIAARGIDIRGVSHVVNYELPDVAESYVHRIGRTGRAGQSGRAVSFCDQEERPLLRDIERLIKKRIPSLDVASVLGTAAIASNDGAASADAPSTTEPSAAVPRPRAEAPDGQWRSRFRRSGRAR